MPKDKCKCRNKPACEECPDWIFTFADLVMLTMAFFVILWVLKPAPRGRESGKADNEDWISVAAAIREAFGYLPDPHSSDPVDLHMLLKKMHTINPVRGPKLGSRSRFEQHGALGTDPEVQTIRDGKHAVIGGRVLFEPGSAELTPDARRQLDQIVEQVRGHLNIVQVKGHTALDDVPPNATSQQQMDLSIRRAQTAADYLAGRGVEPRIIRVQGCSIFEPVVERAYTSESRALNRRVEVETTSALSTDREGGRQAAPATSQPAAASVGGR